MAKITLAEAIVNEINNSKGAVTKVENGKFNKPVRSMDAGDPLSKGDVITIPEDYQVLQTIINSMPEKAKEAVDIVDNLDDEKMGKIVNLSETFKGLVNQVSNK